MFGFKFTPSILTFNAQNHSKLTLSTSEILRTGISEISQNSTAYHELLFERKQRNFWILVSDLLQEKNGAELLETFYRKPKWRP